MSSHQTGRPDCPSRLTPRCYRSMSWSPLVRTSRITEEGSPPSTRPKDLEGEKTMRARVIRELINEIRLRRELAQAEGRAPVSRPEV